MAQDRIDPAGRQTDRTSDRTAQTGSRSWTDEERWWRENWRSRPYAEEGRNFEDFQPGYRYGFESAGRMSGRSWDEAEPELRAGWEGYEHKGRSTWDEIKDSVRDAWDNLTGKDDDHDRHMRS